jgi:glycosyltransferase involved in cell wall biosynthesis
MPGLRFSIVIPTRERAATLYHSLRTCLSQQFDRFEVIVSDNAGSPATRAVVESFASPRMRYVRTPRLMAMCSNWDFAVGHAEGEFVFVLGDDDGLLPHALVELDRFITTHDARAVRWTAAYYTWPDHAVPGVGNYLRVPLARGARYVEARPAIAEVIAFRRCYSTLPMLYNSVVHRDLIDTLRKRSGRVFSHRIPDVYSGFAVAAAAGGYWSLDTPMSVSGQSGQSTGVANLFLRGRSRLSCEPRSSSSLVTVSCHWTGGTSLESVSRMWP